jgi:hypothetical protein
MRINASKWGKVVELERAKTRAKTGPIVFNFRPTKYLEVRPEKLKEWEKLFMANVGTKPSRDLAYEWSGDPKETISGSNNDWDDCDYW